MRSRARSHRRRTWTNSKPCWTASRKRTYEYLRPRLHLGPRSASAPPLVLGRLQPWILPVWSLGVLLLSLRLVAGALAVRALRRHISVADDRLRERVALLATRMGLRRPVHVVASSRADGPSVIGWLRPLILLP